MKRKERKILFYLFLGFVLVMLLLIGDHLLIIQNRMDRIERSQGSILRQVMGDKYAAEQKQ